MICLLVSHGLGPHTVHGMPRGMGRALRRAVAVITGLSLSITVVWIAMAHAPAQGLWLVPDPAGDIQSNAGITIQPYSLPLHALLAAAAIAFSPHPALWAGCCMLRNSRLCHLSPTRPASTPSSPRGTAGGGAGTPAHPAALLHTCAAPHCRRGCLSSAAHPSHTIRHTNLTCQPFVSQLAAARCVLCGMPMRCCPCPPFLLNLNALSGWYSVSAGSQLLFSGSPVQVDRTHLLHCDARGCGCLCTPASDCDWCLGTWDLDLQVHACNEEYGQEGGYTTVEDVSGGQPAPTLYPLEHVHSLHRRLGSSDGSCPWQVSLSLHTYSTSRPGYSGAILFEQTMLQGFQGTRAVPPQSCVQTHCKRIPPILNYPSFDLTRGEASSAVAFTWAGTFATLSPFSPSKPPGRGAGPVMWKTVSSPHYTAIVLPLSHALDHVVSGSKAVASWGLSSEIDSLPNNTTLRVLLLVGDGITDTVALLRQVLGEYHHLARPPASDLVTSTLGYWTDNGAFYYSDIYDHAPSCCNHSVLVAAVQKMVADGVPIRYVQMDDWWYRGHKAVFVNCATKWVAKNNLFPGGMAGLSHDLSLPLLVYFAFFCPKNEYATQCDFVSDSTRRFAVPGTKCESDKLFSMMLSEHGQMAGFEIDFLDHNLLAVPSVRGQAGRSQGWLDGLESALHRRGLSQQWCMALPGHALASLTCPSVTSFRTSQDYAWNGNVYFAGGGAAGVAHPSSSQQRHFLVSWPGC